MFRELLTVIPVPSYHVFRISEAESGDWERQAEAAADRSMFVQELLLSSLCEGLRLDNDDPEDEMDTYTEQQPAPQPPPPVNNPAPAVVVVDTPHNCNNSSSPPASAATNNKQRNKVREPPPKPATQPLSSSPSSKLVKQ